MISICPSCSGIDVEILEEKFGKENIELCCLGECGGVDNMTIGYVNGQYIEKETEKKFVKELEKLEESIK